MKKHLLFVLLLASSKLIFAQEKITWDFSFNSKSQNIEMKATLAEGWHLYSQFINNKIGPVPTSFTYYANDQIKLVGKTEEPTPIEEYDENFEATLDFFKGSPTFTQKVNINTNQIIKGKVEYMVCNDRMCLPPTEQEFQIELISK